MVLHKIKYNAAFLYEPPETEDACSYSIWFPDLYGCISCASDEEDALYMAHDALEHFIYKKQLGELPYPRDGENIIQVIPLRYVVQRGDPYTYSLISDADSSTAPNETKSLTVVVLNYRNCRTFLCLELPDYFEEFNYRTTNYNTDNTEYRLFINETILAHLNETYPNEPPTVSSSDCSVKIHSIEVEVDVDATGIITTPGVIEYDVDSQAPLKQE